MSATYCEVCKTKVMSGGMRAHERSAGHQRTAPLAAEARLATEQAIAQGLVRMTEHDFSNWDTGTPFLDSIGVRTERLLTSYARSRNHSWKYPEWWTEAWAAPIADWRGLDVATRERALARVAADPSLRAYVPHCPLVLEFQGVTVTINHKRYVQDMAMLSDEHAAGADGLSMATISISGHGRGNTNMWHVHFDGTGSIVDIVPFRVPHLEINTPEDAPPLSVMVEAQGAIEHFARCNAAIRWLASDA